MIEKGKVSWKVTKKASKVDFVDQQKNYVSVIWIHFMRYDSRLLTAE